MAERDSAVVIDAPLWNEDALVARCLQCWEHPGSAHDDGSGVCSACGGSGWHVLTTRGAGGREALAELLDSFAIEACDVDSARASFSPYLAYAHAAQLVRTSVPSPAADAGEHAEGRGPYHPAPTPSQARDSEAVVAGRQLVAGLLTMVVADHGEDGGGVAGLDQLIASAKHYLRGAAV